MIKRTNPRAPTVNHLTAWRNPGFQNFHNHLENLRIPIHTIEKDIIFYIYYTL